LVVQKFALPLQSVSLKKTSGVNEFWQQNCETCNNH